MCYGHHRRPAPNLSFCPHRGPGQSDQAIARKIEQQISELEEFQQRHPEEAEAPSPFEVFCDLNPSDINCRVYDD